MSAQTYITKIGRGLRFIELSNYAGQKAEDLRRQRHEANAAAGQSYQERLAQLESDLKQARRETVHAISMLRLLDAWRWWREARIVRWALRKVRTIPPQAKGASIEEQQAIAGEDAEKRLDVFLAGSLGEKWTLIAGYSGRNGEIDRILIGPWGVFAFEIKGNRGVIHSDGARWWVERFGRRGNPLGTKTLPRAPDAQLAKTAGWLEGRLHRNGIDLRVGRVILFAANDARIGVIHAANADLVTTLRELDLGSLFDPGSKRSALAPAVCERIVNLVERDHAFWEQTRSGMPDAGRKAKRDRLSQPSFAGL